MTQPFAWDSEGKPEWGFDYGSYLFTDCYPAGQNNTRYRSKVTNLRKAKVVDEDAITISRSLWLEIQEPNEGSESWQNAFRWMVRQIKSENPQLSPPITEPKTYLTTDQFIKICKSLSDKKLRELEKARDAAVFAARDVARYAGWCAARYAAYSAANSAAWDEAYSAAWDAAWYTARDANLAIRAKDKITTEQFNILMHPWTSCDLSPFAEDWEAVLNPKVGEPKNFGAIVEATYNGARGLFFNDGTKTVPWCARNESANCFWDELINPTIKSEGLEG